MNTTRVILFIFYVIAMLCISAAGYYCYSFDVGALMFMSFLFGIYAVMSTYIRGK